MVYKWLLLGVVAALTLQWTLKEVQADSQLSEDELALLREVKELASAERANLEARDMGDNGCDDDNLECICDNNAELCIGCIFKCEGDDDVGCVIGCLQDSIENRMLETAQQQQRNLDISLDDEDAAKKRFLIRRRRASWGRRRRLGK